MLVGGPKTARERDADPVAYHSGHPNNRLLVLLDHVMRCYVSLHTEGFFRILFYKILFDAFFTDGKLYIL